MDHQRQWWITRDGFLARVVLVRTNTTREPDALAAQCGCAYTHVHRHDIPSWSGKVSAWLVVAGGAVPCCASRLRLHAAIRRWSARRRSAATAARRGKRRRAAVRRTRRWLLTRCAPARCAAATGRARRRSPSSAPAARVAARPPRCASTHSTSYAATPLVSVVTAGGWCSRCGRVGEARAAVAVQLEARDVEGRVQRAQQRRQLERHRVVVHAADDLERADVAAGQLVRAAAQLQALGGQQHLVARLEQQQAAVPVGQPLLPAPARAPPCCARGRAPSSCARARSPAAGTVAGRASSSAQSIGRRASVPYTSVKGAAPVDACCLLLKRQLERRQVLVPVVAHGVGVAAQRGDERLDLALRLAVRLRVVRRRQVDLAAQQARQLAPELAP